MSNAFQNGQLGGRVALVTGASSGIGRALAVALSSHGADVCIVGRNRDALAETAAAVRQSAPVTVFPADLTVAESLHPLISHLEKIGHLDVLIHCAGVIHASSMARASIEDFDIQYTTNVRAPYLLTKRVLPFLEATRGQVVFVNSSAGLKAHRPDIGQYAATKHALRAIADSLREEVNPKGIRVLTVYLGRTATPMQASLHEQEGKAYQPHLLLQPDDVAAVVIHTLMLPPTAEVTDLSIRPTIKLC
jgi:NAD(P)-dependent dehydrogenase (short-subunit alcohol dehydrogenase family)